MKPDITEILGQWHGYPDKEEGEHFRTPPMYVALRQDKWHILGYYTEKRISTDKDRKSAFPETIIPAQEGVWDDWIFHIKWDYRTQVHGGTGSVIAWLQVNGKGYNKIIDYKGPIGYNDQRGTYFRWGLYKQPWFYNKNAGIQSPRIVYYDEVKIGDAHATFNDMRVGSQWYGF